MADETTEAAHGAIGVVALVGGDEFRPSSRPLDEELLAATRCSPPRVAILPTAAAHQRPELAVANGVRHFRALGAEADAVMLLNGADANDNRIVGQINRADVVYLTGGDPGHLLTVLAGSKAWGRMRARLAEGAVLAGSSAGAMVLCEGMYSRGGWRDALDLVRGACVLPHFERRVDSVFETLQQAAADRGAVVLGIDGGAACIRDGTGWRVAGSGGVTILDRGKVATYRPGERLRLER